MPNPNTSLAYNPATIPSQTQQFATNQAMMPPQVNIHLNKEYFQIYYLIINLKIYNIQTYSISFLFFFFINKHF